MKPILLFSSETDPVRNLSHEEFLFNSLNPGEAQLFLYANSPAIIIGSFQNPWLECDVDWLLERKIPVLRRISGGGTVWHDPGNLNFSWMGPRKDFDRKGLLVLMQSLLATLHVFVDISDRGDLLHYGKKISGNALCYRSDRVLHHATLLIDADLNSLRRALRPEWHGWQFKRSLGVRSQSSPVNQLIEILPIQQREEVLPSLLLGIERICTGTIQSIDSPTGPIYEELLEKYQSWDWNFGRTPDFTISPTSVFASANYPDILVSHGGINLETGLMNRPFPGFNVLANILDLGFNGPRTTG